MRSVSDRSGICLVFEDCILDFPLGNIDKWEVVHKSVSCVWVEFTFEVGGFTFVIMCCSLRLIWASGDWWGQIYPYAFGPVWEAPDVVWGGLFQGFGGPVSFLCLAESLEEVAGFQDIVVDCWVELACGSLVCLVEASGVCYPFSCSWSHQGLALVDGFLSLAASAVAFCRVVERVSA